MEQRYYYGNSDDRRGARPFEPRDRSAGQAYSAGYSQGAGQSVGQNMGNVVIHSPKTYADVQLLIDHLKARQQVIVDLSTINRTSVYRILDFMSGAIYALGGSIQQIKKDLFLFVPQGVSITLPSDLQRR